VNFSTVDEFGDGSVGGGETGAGRRVGGALTVEKFGQKRPFSACFA